MRRIVVTGFVVLSFACWGRSGFERRAGPPETALSGEPPRVESLEVRNATPGVNAGTRVYEPGDVVEIAWTVTDREGLRADPIALYYTTDGESWRPIVERYGELPDASTRYSDQYRGFAAPGRGFFRIKLLAWDRAGNSSLPVWSDSQNTSGWSVYAGTRDPGVGATGRRVGVGADSNVVQKIALDPVRGDLYAEDALVGVLRVDAETGIATYLMRLGEATNLPDDGPMPAEPTYYDHVSLAFDGNGLLYVCIGDSYELSDSVIYQIHPDTRWVRRYLGGGTSFGGTATPATVAMSGWQFQFDERNSVYFYASCTPGVWNDTSTVRLMKVVQRSDGAAGTLSVVAGNCVRGTPASPGPVDALTSPLTASSLPMLGSLAVWNEGEVIYYAAYKEPVRKIIAGEILATDVTISEAGTSLAYDATQNRLLAADGPLTSYVPELSAAGGEEGMEYVSNRASGSNCVQDGVAARDACAHGFFSVHVSPGGRVLFVDGFDLNDSRDYRVRTIEDDGKLRTMLGLLPFFEDGVSRRVLRSAIAGIHYKGRSAANPAAFPAGLYFMDRQGAVMAHVPFGTDLVTVLGGTQQGREVVHPTGTPFDSSVGLGDAYKGGNAAPLAFDAAGLPWFRYSNVVARVDANGALVQLQEGTGRWTRAADGADPFDHSAFPYGLWQNLAIKGEGIFFIGRYIDDAPAAAIKYFDFGVGTVTRIMGSAPDGVSPDDATPGSAVDASLSGRCFNQEPCFVVYRANEDRLYFGEQSAIRFITDPTDTAASTLGTLMTHAAGDDVENFIFSQDGARLFYLVAGQLHCHTITGATEWCDGTPLGPPVGLSSIVPGPNQLTWMNERELLLSNYRGEVYRYTLPP